MKHINRMMTNICSDQLAESKAFYTQLFDMKVDFDSNWFIHLISRGRDLELGIIDRHHEIVPEAARSVSGGHYLTFVVDNVDDVFEIADQAGFDIIRQPEDTFYGQRRLLLRDPNGIVVDVSAPMENFNI